MEGGEHMTYQEYRVSIVPKAQKYLNQIKEHKEKFNVELQNNKIQRLELIPDKWLVFHEPRGLSDNDHKRLVSLLISIDSSFLPAITTIWTLGKSTGKYNLTDRYLVWNTSSEVTAPIFERTNPVPIVPYYYVEEQDNTVVTYVDWEDNTIADIENVYPNQDELGNVLALWKIINNTPDIKNQLLAGWLQYGNMLDDNKRTLIAKRFGAEQVEFDAPAFVRWFSQQRSDTIMLVRYLIDTRTLLDKYKDALSTIEEEEELDLEETQSTEQSQYILETQTTSEQQATEQSIEQPQSVEKETEPVVEQQHIVEKQRIVGQEHIVEQQTQSVSIEEQQRFDISQLLVSPKISTDEVLAWLKMNYKTNQQWLLPLTLPAVFNYINYFDGVQTPQISLITRFYGIKLKYMLLSNGQYQPQLPVIIDQPIDEAQITQLAQKYYIVCLQPVSGVNIVKLPVLTQQQIHDIPQGMYLALLQLIKQASIDIDSIVVESLSQPPIKRDGYIVHRIITTLF